MCVCFILPYYLARFSRRKLCIGAAECRGWRQTPVTNLNNPWNLEGWLVFPRFPQMLTDARRIASIAALFLVPVFARVPVEAFGKTYFFWLKHCRRTDGPWSLPALLELCDFIIFHYLVHLVQLSRGTLEPLISQCTGRWSIKVDGETRCLVCRFPGQLMPRQNYTCRERERLKIWSWAHTTVSSFSGSSSKFVPRLLGGVVRCACACCSSTRTVCLVHQLELSLQSCAHFRPSFPGPRPETAKNWPSLQATWIWINAGFRTFPLCLLSPSFAIFRQTTALEKVQHACPHKVFRTLALCDPDVLWVSVCLIGK